jgi:hypothetical protein
MSKGISEGLVYIAGHVHVASPMQHNSGSDEHSRSSVAVVILFHSAP